jgi:hypothetical protein
MAVRAVKALWWLKQNRCLRTYPRRSSCSRKATTSRGATWPRSIFLALQMGRPLLLEGEAGVGKTEIAKVLAATLGRDLIRLQCFEGLDLASAAYEWNYPQQMVAIRLAEAEGSGSKISDSLYSGGFPDRTAVAESTAATREWPAGVADRRDRSRG